MRLLLFCLALRLKNPNTSASKYLINYERREKKDDLLLKGNFYFSRVYMFSTRRSILVPGNDTDEAATSCGFGLLVPNSGQVHGTTHWRLKSLVCIRRPLSKSKEKYHLRGDLASLMIEYICLSNEVMRLESMMPHSPTPSMPLAS